MAMTALSPAEKLTDTRSVVIATLLMLAVLAVFWLIGKTDRVIYLGPDHGQVAMTDQVPLKTAPAGHYFIERNAIYAAMKPGCRYDVTYPPTYGRGNRAPGGHTKHIRSATLVDCP